MLWPQSSRGGGGCETGVKCQYLSTPCDVTGILFFLHVLFLGTNTSICVSVLSSGTHFSLFLTYAGTNLVIDSEHLLHLQINCHTIWRSSDIYAKRFSLLPDSNDLRSSPQEELCQRHSYGNPTWQPESLSFIIMVPANSFKDISTVPLLAGC